MSGQDFLNLVGQSLSERVAAVWSKLTDAERAEFAACTTEDEFRALLAKHEAVTAEELFATWEYGVEGVIRIFAHLDPLEWNQGEPAYSPATQEFIHRCREWVRVQDEEGN